MRALLCHAAAAAALAPQPGEAQLAERGEGVRGGTDGEDVVGGQVVREHGAHCDEHVERQAEEVVDGALLRVGHVPG